MVGTDRLGDRFANAAGRDQLAHLFAYRLGIRAWNGRIIPRRTDHRLLLDGRRRGGRCRSPATDDDHSVGNADMQRDIGTGDFRWITARVADLCADGNRFGGLGL